MRHQSVTMMPTPKGVGDGHEVEIDEIEMRKRMAKFQNHDFTKFKELAFELAFLDLQSKSSNATINDFES